MSLYLTIPPLTAFLVFMVLAVVVMYRERRTTSYRLFAVFLLSMGLWGLIIYGMRTSADAESALVWRRILPAVGGLASVTFYHFSVLHTRARPRGRVLTAGYVTLAAIAALSSTDLLVAGMTTDAYGYLPITGPLNNLASALSYGFLILGLVNFVRAYRRSTKYRERNSYIYFFVGISCSMLGGMVDYMSVMGYAIAPVGLIGNILFGALTTVAILKYQLMDIHIVFRKGLSYVLMSSAVAIPYVGVIILFNRYFGFGSVSLWSSLILLSILAVFLQPFWRGAQGIVDRLFFRERYEFLRQLEDYGREAHDIRDLTQLGSSLVRLVSRALQTPGVNLLLRSESGDLKVFASTDETEITLAAGSPLVQWLKGSGGLLYRRDLNIIPQLQSLPARELEAIEGIGVELFVPLRTKEEDLVGFFTLGQNTSRQPYSDTDERLVLSVASRMAIELENARLYALEQSMRHELERQDELKTEFLHTVAHELKTPLTAIVSSSDLMTSESSVATLEQRERLGRNINRSAWLMDKRVGELLDLAKIQIGSLMLHLEVTDIGTPIREVVTQLQTLFNNKRQTLTVEVLDGLPPVDMDRERVEQVLVNLLSNANKFSPTDGEIKVVASQADGRIIVEVRDSAAVITDEDRVRLFDPYYRGGDGVIRQRVPGLGLGLTISRRIIELHEGRVWVESEEGRGNTFIFSLPIPGEGSGEPERRN